MTTTKRRNPQAAPILRSDYASANKDFIVDQDITGYSKEEHRRWSVLFAQQKEAAHRFSSELFCNALARLEKVAPLHIGIPRFSDFNPTLSNHTGWELVAVPGLIPDDVFFAHLAKRQFPITTWIRQAHEMDYIVEPDVFHDFFGHVPLLTDPAVAKFLQRYGEQAATSNPTELTKLASLYWYTIEFGLIREGNTIKAFGAGLLTSRTELEHSTTCFEKHQDFNAQTIRNSGYEIDAFQAQYFVLERLQDLLGIV
jgi:phenylalanine-4-hydroxylase